MPSFFLMIRRPPQPPLFPSPPLFRPPADKQSADLFLDIDVAVGIAQHRQVRMHRSEEHTSELQSRFGISYAVFFFNDPPTPSTSPLPLPAPLPTPRRQAIRRPLP